MIASDRLVLAVGRAGCRSPAGSGAAPGRRRPSATRRPRPRSTSPEPEVELRQPGGPSSLGASSLSCFWYLAAAARSPSLSARLESCWSSAVSRGLAASSRSSSCRAVPKSPDGGVRLGQADRHLALAGSPRAARARAGRAGGRTGCSGGTGRSAARRSPSLPSRSVVLSKARQYSSIASSVRNSPASVSARVSSALRVGRVGPGGAAAGRRAPRRSRRAGSRGRRRTGSAPGCPARRPAGRGRPRAPGRAGRAGPPAWRPRSGIGPRAAVELGEPAVGVGRAAAGRPAASWSRAAATQAATDFGSSPVALPIAADRLGGACGRPRGAGPAGASRGGRSAPSPASSSFCRASIRAGERARPPGTP